MAFDHRAASGEAPVEDFRRHLGDAYLEAADVGGYAILDEARQAILEAWVVCLIPGDEHWPTALDARAPAYVDATLARAPVLRPLVLRILDAAERVARIEHDAGFAELDAARRSAILRDLSAADGTGGFDCILELSFEAYYRDPAVNRVIEARTGFRTANPVLGSRMEPFPEHRLDRVKAMEPRYREVPA